MPKLIAIDPARSASKQGKYMLIFFYHTFPVSFIVATPRLARTARPICTINTSNEAFGSFDYTIMFKGPEVPILAPNTTFSAE
jgi:hypothetical protein